jgi:hypothetical protein
MAFEDRVEVLSASPIVAAAAGAGIKHTSLDAQDALSNVNSIQHLFAEPSTEDEAQIRAHKRRKLEQRKESPPRSDENVERKCVELASVTLGLVSACATLRRVALT